MVKRIQITILTLMLLINTGCSSETGLKSPKSATEFVGLNYKDAIVALENAGFKSIETEVIEDLTSKSISPDGEVEKVIINNGDTYGVSDVFPLDSTAKVVYHIIPKINLPADSEDFEFIETDKIISQLEEAGFTNIQVNELYDIDPDETDISFRNDISINGNEVFYKDDEMPFDSEIQVVTHYPFVKYNALIHIIFRSNLIFSKYDVDVSTNGVKQVTLKHGEDKDLTLRLKEGNYVITFAQHNSTSAYGEVSIALNSDVEAEYNIWCFNDHIDVKTNYVDYKNEMAQDEVKMMNSESSYRFEKYQDVIADLREIGFTNIQEEVKYDIVFGITEPYEVSKVTINGNTDYKRGDVFKKDVPVVITYHLRSEDDPTKQEKQTTASTNTPSVTTSTIPEEPKRAAVVALTNYYAMDVFTEDGNDIDTNKYHSYADTSGDTSLYYMTVTKWGTWKEILKFISYLNKV